MSISMHGDFLLVGGPLVGFDNENYLDGVDTVVSFTNCSGDETKYGQCHHRTAKRTDANCLHYAHIFCQGKYFFLKTAFFFFLDTNKLCLSLTSFTCT